MDDSSQKERMNRIMEQLARMGSADVEAVREEMPEEGEDPEAIRNQGMEFVSRLKGQLRLSEAGAERQKAMSKLEELRSEVRRRLEEVEEGAKELIQRLEAHDGADLSVSFRKIESLDDDEILELLTEAQLVDLLDEMDDEEE
jgi:hypothetical protein